jgi:hydrogenase maturation protein HypF
MSILNDLRNNIPVSKISSRFHNSITRLCLDLCLALRKETGLSSIALTGGVWQNALLLQKTKHALSESGFTVLIHQKVPTNDACISLGQAIIAARMTI